MKLLIMATCIRLNTVILLCGVCLLPAMASGQDAFDTSVHWAYSSYFGTGWYRVSDDREVFVIRASPRWNLREAQIDDDGNRRLGYRLKLPITAGLNHFSFDDLPGAIEPQNLGSLMLTPGIDLDIPVNQRWTLRPFASLGWGTLLDGSESSWTYWAGVKSRFSFQSGKLNWALLNSAGFVGYSPSHAKSEKFWPISIGLEFDYPIFAPDKNGDQYLFMWHANYTTFEDDIDFELDGFAAEPITDQWELAIAIGKRDKRLRIWFMNFDRVGLGYRFSSNGELKGVNVVFRSIFDL